MTDRAAGYRTIVVDPPWDYPEGFMGFNRTVGKWSERIDKPLPYASMTVEEISQLPVSDLAGSSAAVFLWTTNKYLPYAFGVIASWGFVYRQTIIWHKQHGLFGGSIAPNHAEFLLVARRGYHRWSGRSVSSVVSARFNPRNRAHSRKPDVFLDIVEQVSPGPYLELFARRQRLGWDTWGNEALEHVEVAP
jgi:N6-adenosine-specific RNA methylase IME4